MKLKSNILSKQCSVLVNTHIKGILNPVYMISPLWMNIGVWWLCGNYYIKLKFISNVSPSPTSVHCEAPQGTFESIAVLSGWRHFSRPVIFKPWSLWLEVIFATAASIQCLAAKWLRHRTLVPNVPRWTPTTRTTGRYMRGLVPQTVSGTGLAALQRWLPKLVDSTSSASGLW